jgi:hypothetical protein
VRLCVFSSKKFLEIRFKIKIHCVYFHICQKIVLSKNQNHILSNDSSFDEVQ